MMDKIESFYSNLIRKFVKVQVIRNEKSKGKLFDINLQDECLILIFYNETKSPKASK